MWSNSRKEYWEELNIDTINSEKQPLNSNIADLLTLITEKISQINRMICREENK